MTSASRKVGLQPLELPQLQVESLLSTDLFRAAAGASPAALRLALSPPLDVKDVAGAAVAGAAGRARGTLGNHDAILAAARG